MVMIRRRKLYISFKVATGMVAGNAILKILLNMIKPWNRITYYELMGMM
jgi:hypothetical protein